MKELVIEAKPENLHSVLEFIKCELDRAGWLEKTKTQIILAVEEIFVNIAYYAYTPEVGRVTIRISAETEVIIEFEDKGTPYNPLDEDDPDINVELGERKIGGLGVFMVKKIMDSVEYRHIDKKNILTIKKKAV